MWPELGRPYATSTESSARITIEKRVEEVLGVLARVGGIVLLPRDGQRVGDDVVKGLLRPLLRILKRRRQRRPAWAGWRQR